MTHIDKGHYAKKHPADQKVSEGILKAVKKKVSAGEIACAVAFTIAESLKVPPSDVGLALDLLEMPIVKCQLGLFGYRPQKRIVRPSENIPKDLEEAIHAGLTDGRLPCATAWEIAERLSVTKMAVSSMCETLKIKVSSCQLGAF